jgi:hypothetical protein
LPLEQPPGNAIRGQRARWNALEGNQADQESADTRKPVPVKEYSSGYHEIAPPGSLSLTRSIAQRNAGHFQAEADYKIFFGTSHRYACFFRRRTASNHRKSNNWEQLEGM